ncbi:hypothetical protein [Limnoraphis robusta]|uniref:hypothetical protein n=1 Tax=Limnoraphis robusta TaxID=1118279 RepID=UPI003CC9D8B7
MTLANSTPTDNQNGKLPSFTTQSQSPISEEEMRQAVRTWRSRTRRKPRSRRLKRYTQTGC